MLIVNILIIAGLIVLNGLLALSEMAVVSSRRARLRQLIDENRRGARLALSLVESPGRFLSTVQIGITLVGVLAGAFGGATLAAPFAQSLERMGIPAGHAYSAAFAVVVGLTTYFTLIVGELVPKYVALRQPERIASLIAGPMKLLSRIARPWVWMLDISTRAVLAVFGIHGTGDSTVTENEVRSMISEGTAEGVFDPREQAMIDGVLRLDDRSARSVMVPRPDVVWLDVDDDLTTVREKIAATGYSRFLVCHGEVDKFAGIVRTRDILDVLLRGETLDLARCMVEPVVVLDSTPVIALMDRFKNTRMHLAVVVDEYGSMAGIATMTDVVEVIAGDLPEHWENDSDEAVQRVDGNWLVDGMMDIEDFENVLGVDGVGNGKDYHTVAGFVLHRLETMPGVGDHVFWNDIQLEVVDMDGHRIDKVLVTLPAEQEDDAGAGGNAGDDGAA